MKQNNSLYEDILNDAIQDFLISRCIRYTWQIPALGGRIDFVGIRPSYEVIAIEAKLSRWRNALKQAKKYQLLADKVYVAVPEKVARNALKKKHQFKESGVGLISVGFNTRILIRASALKLALPKLREYLLDYTLARKHQAFIRVSERVKAIENTWIIQPHALINNRSDTEVRSFDIRQT